MSPRSNLLPLAATALFVCLLMTTMVSAQSDADGDGVEDADDDCPDTREGDSVDENGCSEEQRNSDVNDSSGPDSSGADGDQDGVDDEHDQCPNTPYSERREVGDSGCTPFFEETFAEDVPLLGRITNGFAISAGTISMGVGAIGWTWRAGKVVGITGGSGKRRKARFLRRINKAKSTVDLDRIKKEVRKANDKNRLPDGAFADLIAADEQRRIDLLNRDTPPTAEKKLKLRPSSKPPGL